MYRTSMLTRIKLYHLSKGNTFKHKRALVEHVCFPSFYDKPSQPLHLLHKSTSSNSIPSLPPYHSPLHPTYLANTPLIRKRTKIHKAKAEKARERILKEEMDAKRAKTKAARERRQERITTKRTALLGGDEEEEPKKE